MNKMQMTITKEKLQHIHKNYNMTSRVMQL